jgi:hypothetical protein
MLRTFADFEIRIIALCQALAFKRLVGPPSLFCPLLDQAAFRGARAPKKKSHRQVRSGDGILEVLVMILEY